MEKHRCKLCFKNFSNGRALGGHMRSHMLNLPIRPRQEEEEEELEVVVEEEEEPPQPPPITGGDDTESGSLSSSSSPSSDDEEEGEEKLLGVYYGLRENPKRSFRLVDPEFSVAAAAVDAGSVVLQDRESETESSKNPTRRRSKRTRKLDHHHHFHHHNYPHHHHQYHQQRLESQQENINIKKFKFHKTTESSSWAHEPEPVSSISDTTTEEDIAFCLMMLSRDKWKRREQQQQHQQQQQRGGGGGRSVFEDEEQDEEADKSMEETDESDEFKSCKNRSRGKYKCETCNKVFKSYQALGGHRASHKKIKFYNTTTTTAATQPNKKPDFEQENAGTSGSTPLLEKTNKTHECPVCLRVFSSGQALGGHKRTHVTGQVATTTTTSTTTITPPPRTTTTKTTHVTSSSTKFGDNLIDLNLPAPVDDDDISQIELSAVSDAEFVNHIKR